MIDIITLEALFRALTSLRERGMCNASAVEIDSLEKELRNVPEDFLAAMPVARDILNHLNLCSKLPMGDNANDWVSLVCSEIEDLDKIYWYRAAEDGENWDVLSTDMTGNTEWKATVQTELLAEHVMHYF